MTASNLGLKLIQITDSTGMYSSHMYVQTVRVENYDAEDSLTVILTGIKGINAQIVESGHGGLNPSAPN